MFAKYVSVSTVIIITGVTLLACGSQVVDEPPGSAVLRETSTPSSISATSESTETRPTVEPQTATPTSAPTPQPTSMSTSTPEPTNTPEPTLDPPTPTPTASPVPTTIAATSTPAPTRKPMPTATATATPVPVPTPTPKPTVGPGNEQRNIFLPLAGEVQLTVQRSAPGAARSIDLLEQLVRFAEEFMGEPFPNRSAIALFKRAAQSAEGAGGTNFGNVFSMLPEYDVDDGGPYAQAAGLLMAHEVAHFYWRGRQKTWIKEGAAELMATMSEHARTGRPIRTVKLPCAYASNIAELEVLSPRHPSDGGLWDQWNCHYALGERLLLDLYHVMGDEDFRKGFRNLWLALDNYNYVGIDVVREKFQLDADAETAAAVDAVFARWYEGDEPYDLSRLDDDPADPDLLSINGQITETFISLDQEWPVESRDYLFSVEEIDGTVYVYLRFKFQATEASKVVPLEYVEYFEDGLVYRSRVVRHLFKPEWTFGWWRVPLGYRPSSRWATGRYGVAVYDGERKVAQVEYEVTP